MNVETVRYYERRGLLERPPASAGGRDYGGEALWRLRYIRTAKSWGWKLADIAALLDEAVRSSNFCQAVRQTARRRIDEIDRQLADLAVQRDQLEKFISDCAAKPDEDRCPIFRRIRREQ